MTLTLTSCNCDAIETTSEFAVLSILTSPFQSQERRESEEKGEHLPRSAYTSAHGPWR